MLAEQSAEFRALRSRSLVGAPKVGEALPTDAALVSFVRYDHTSFDAGGSDPRRRLPQAQATGPAYLAFVLRKGRQPIAVPLGPAAFTDRLVSRWRTDIAAEAVQTPSAGNPTVRSSRVSGTALRRRVWDAISPHLTGVARVFIVPDGTLSLVPFAALPAPVDTYLLETGPILHYLSAERDLANSAEGALGEGLLAVGGPAFDAAARTPAAKASLVRAAGPEPCGDFQAATFQPLRGTLRELQDVSAAWSESHSATGPIRLLTGVEANETAFKAAAPKFRVVHLATHGFFLGTCQPSIVSTRAVGGLVTAGSRRERSNDSPLRLSGLALSGANRRAFARADEDDGILTSEEVASLDLSGVQWAVLSACDTGLGEIPSRRRRSRPAARVPSGRRSHGDHEPVVRRRPERHANGCAPSTTRRFRAGLDTAHAVHNATLSVLRARRAKGQSTHPFYWAAFVAAGDWR